MKTERNGTWYEAVMVYFTIDEWEKVFAHLHAESKRRENNIPKGTFIRELVLDGLGIEPKGE
jgi:hypothetical protein